MADTITEEKQEMVVTGPDGIAKKTVVTVTKTDHHETDKDGNPKISVKISVPPTIVGVQPGKVE